MINRCWCKFAAFADSCRLVKHNNISTKTSIHPSLGYFCSSVRRRYLESNPRCLQQRPGRRRLAGRDRCLQLRLRDCRCIACTTGLQLEHGHGKLLPAAHCPTGSMDCTLELKASRPILERASGGHRPQWGGHGPHGGGAEAI